MCCDFLQTCHAHPYLVPLRNGTTPFTCTIALDVCSSLPNLSIRVIYRTIIFSWPFSLKSISSPVQVLHAYNTGLRYVMHRFYLTIVFT